MTGNPPSPMALGPAHAWGRGPAEAPSPAAVGHSRAHGRYDRFVKPIIDRLGALVLCLLFAPVLLAVTVTLLLTLGRPLMIRQRRVGRNGRTFDMYKFRTMHPCRRNQPCRRKQPRDVAMQSDRRRRHKAADDPRHTDVGRFLRRYSLDELPQLWNVVRGDMSLVGPRPELEQVVTTSYAAWQHQRHLVKPGVTGLWQVTERAHSDGDMHLHTEVDLAYIERISLRTDLWILVRTPFAALGKGA